jgi:hypothetical protein
VPKRQWHGRPNESFLVIVGLMADDAVIADVQRVGATVDDQPRIHINAMAKNEGNSGTTPLVQVPFRRDASNRISSFSVSGNRMWDLPFIRQPDSTRR